MTGRRTTRVTWPWLLGGLVAAFAGARLVTSLTGVAWVGYGVFLLILMGTLMLFSWTHSRG